MLLNFSCLRPPPVRSYGKAAVVEMGALQGRVDIKPLSRPSRELHEAPRSRRPKPSSLLHLPPPPSPPLEPTTVQPPVGRKLPRRSLRHVKPRPKQTGAHHPCPHFGSEAEGSGPPKLGLRALSFPLTPDPTPVDSGLKCLGAGASTTCRPAGRGSQPYPTECGLSSDLASVRFEVISARRKIRDSAAVRTSGGAKLNTHKSTRAHVVPTSLLLDATSSSWTTPLRPSHPTPSSSTGSSNPFLPPPSRHLPTAISLLSSPPPPLVPTLFILLVPSHHPPTSPNAPKASRGFSGRRARRPRRLRGGASDESATGARRRRASQLDRRDGAREEPREAGASRGGGLLYSNGLGRSFTASRSLLRRELDASFSAPLPNNPTPRLDRHPPQYLRHSSLPSLPTPSFPPPSSFPSFSSSPH